VAGSEVRLLRSAPKRWTVAAIRVSTRKYSRLGVRVMSAGAGLASTSWGRWPPCLRSTWVLKRWSAWPFQMEATTEVPSGRGTTTRASTGMATTIPSSVTSCTEER
jgi:hypothetical protein